MNYKMVVRWYDMLLKVFWSPLQVNFNAYNLAGEALRSESEDYYAQKQLVLKDRICKFKWTLSEIIITNSSK